MSRYNRKEHVPSHEYQHSYSEETWGNSHGMLWKQVYITLCHFFDRVFGKLHKYGARRLTFMLVPHSERKIFHLQVSNYILVLVAVVCMVTFSVAVVSIADNQQVSGRLVRLKSVNNEQEQVIAQLGEGIRSLHQYFMQFKVDVNRAFQTATPARADHYIEGVGVFNADMAPTSTNMAEGVRDLYKIQKELDITKAHVRQMGLFISEHKKLVQEIPSRSPLGAAGYVTSGFGYRIHPIDRVRRLHEGIDFGAFPGTRIHATADGEVKFVGYRGGYGIVVELQHKYQFTTRYAHMSQAAPGLRIGQKIKQGQFIGIVGSTGRSTGIHLHYEIRVSGQPINPRPYLGLGR